MVVAVITFLVCTTLIAYTFAIFPLILWARAKWFPRAVLKADILPRVSVVIAAHNEAENIRQRIENIFALDYPSERLSVLIASDGSDDGTNEIVAEYENANLRLIELPRVGKIAALNAAVAQATGEIVVFSDANTLCASDSIRMIVRAFADPTVGGVAGNQQYIRTDSAANATRDGECTYWNMDQCLKEWQTAAGSVTTTTGALYAIRRSLLEPIPRSVADDMFVSLTVIAKGYRLVYESKAIAMEPVAPNAGAEFRRKVRVIALGMKSVLAVRQLLSPARFGFFALQLWSHKVLRWLAIWPMVGALVASMALAGSPLFAFLLWMQCCFYWAALAVWIATASGNLQKVSRAVTLPYFFCLTYVASLHAQWQVARRQSLDRWESVRRQPTRVATEPETIAYIMSRFPKVTETFVLYEILELQRRGESVGVYPLLRQREPVAHAEAADVVARAHYSPFVSMAILRANYDFLCEQPLNYLRTWLEAIRGTFGNLNFMAGALLYFPKSVFFAEQMRKAGVKHIHAHFATHPALSALIIHRLTGISYSFTAHGHDVHCDRRMLPEKLASAAFAVAISRYNRNLMAEECGLDYYAKTHVVHCGVDTSFFYPAPEAKSDVPLRLITVASLWEVKGHAYLIQACRLLRERGIAFHCDLVGDGPLQARLQRQIKVSQLDHVFTFHGPQSRDVVRDMLHQSHVMILPSVPTANGLREGIPVALMEAMACGLPVISSRLSGIPELVEHGVSGILVVPRDIMGLADAIEQLALAPELRERMGLAGHKKIVREFDLVSNAESLAALFDRCTRETTIPALERIAA
jgi:glycosyltransferase involved in cell wall biosynthesis